jgi:hypothetical protein
MCVSKRESEKENGPGCRLVGKTKLDLCFLLSLLFHGMKDNFRKLPNLCDSEPDKNRQVVALALP